ncbi:MAG: hypothetical protein KTR32_00345 [Granulosicoccus sp.]|nr:hypothetical protein [Granulosicoccus sp.]
MLGKYRIYDDFLFLELAQNILNGQWLGELNYRTLIKGVGYPLFIAAVYWMGIPLLTAQQLLYVFGCILAIRAIRTEVQNTRILLAGFALLLFNPFSFFYPMVGTVLRESVYNSFALIFMSSMLGLWLHHGRSTIRGILWALVMSLSLAMLWITREETIWTIPGLILFGILFLQSWGWNRHSHFLFRLVLIFLPIVITLATVFSIGKINQHYYGAPVVNELKSPEFTSALGSLMNINEDGYLEKKIIGEKSERAAFRASPTLAALESAIKIRSQKRHNVFYMWTLRSAVNDGGYYSQGNMIQPALDVYRKIGDELQAACEAETIRCLDRSPTLRPPLYSEHIARLPRIFLELIIRSAGFRSHNADSGEYSSKADMGMLMTFDYVTGHSAVRKSASFEDMRPKFSRINVALKEKIMGNIGVAYRYLMPVLLIFALCCHVLGLIRGRGVSRVALFGLIAGGSVFGILAMLAYVRVTLWDVSRPITVVYPLLIFYAVTMTTSLLPRAKNH